MDCREIERHLRAYLDNEVDADMKDMLAGHLSACAACAKKLSLLEKTSALFRGLPPAIAPAGLDLEPGRKPRDLDDRREAPAAVGRSLREIFHVSGGSSWAVATAGFAAVLMLAGVVTLRSREETMPDRYVEAFFASRRPYYAGMADLSVQDVPELGPGACPWRPHRGP